MASNQLSISLLNLKKVLFFITILSLIPFFQALSLTYPTAFTLEDGNILVIHSLGIDLCDPLYTTHTSQLEFYPELSQSDLSKISISKYDSGEFIILIKNKFYLLDEYGEIILTSSLPSELNAEYFSLSAAVISQDGSIKYYSFLLGYIDKTNGGLYLYYCYLDSQTKTITAYSSLGNYDDDDYIRNTGLSCEFSIKDGDYYILCIYERVYNKYDIIFSIFAINQETIEFVEKKNYGSLNLKYIRSTTKSIGSRPFFCGIDTSQEPLCMNIEYSDFNYVGEDGKKVFYYEPYDKSCINTPYNIRTYYFSETGQYVFSCLTEDFGIQTVIYDKNMAHMVDIETPLYKLYRAFNGCNEFFYYSIIYSEIKKRYYVISDSDCSNYGYFFPLIEEEVEEEEEFKIEEESNIEESFEEEVLKEEEKETEKEKEKLINEEENELIDEEEVEEEKQNESKPEEELKEEEEEELKEEEKVVETEQEEEKNKSELKTKELEEEAKFEEEEEEEEKETEKKGEYEPEAEESEKDKEEVIISENEEEETYICNLEKCSECSRESEELNLCKKCNTEKGYYPLNTGGNSLENQNIDCYDSTTKPEGFYLDENDKEYKLCYSNCKTCNSGGDGNQNNCITCKNNLILNPDIPNSSNCVSKCDHFYYYLGDQYRCTSSEICPEGYKLEIKDKRKCIDTCENDNTHKIQYDGECYAKKPEGTEYDEVNKISKDADIAKCKLNEKILRLISDENITEQEIERKAKLYAEEFSYTEKHVTIYKNDFYSITLYKDATCLAELGLNIDEIDFGECYTKIKDELQITGNLIMVIISKIINGASITIDKFIFNPETKEKINIVSICSDEQVTVKRDLKEQLSNNENFNFIEELAKQDINIFDPNSDFYTDLCFHFKSPIDGKDIPVKDRIKLFFPNITLCEEGYNIKGVNATSWKVLCECTLKDLMNSNPFGNNLLVQKSFGEVQDILTNTNIEVMKCYKDIYDFEMYKKNTGMIIVLILIFFELICIIIYYINSKLKIKKYVLAITDKFLSSLHLIRNNSNPTNNNISEFKDIPKSSPPKNNLSAEALSDKGNQKPIIRNVINNKSKTVVKKKGIMAKNTRQINVHNKSPNKINSSILISTFF